MCFWQSFGRLGLLRQISLLTESFRDISNCSDCARAYPCSTALLRHGSRDVALRKVLVSTPSSMQHPLCSEKDAELKHESTSRKRRQSSSKVCCAIVTRYFDMRAHPYRGQFVARTAFALRAQCSKLACLISRMLVLRAGLHPNVNLCRHP